MPSSRRRRKPGVNAKGGTKMKLSTMLLVVLSLVGCVFSIGVLLGALALNQEQDDVVDKHSYQSKTSNNIQVATGDPALSIPHSIPHLPGAQANGVKPLPRPPPPPTVVRDLTSSTEKKKTLLNSKAAPIAPIAPIVTHPAEVDISTPINEIAKKTDIPTVGAAATTGGAARGIIHRDYSFKMDGENWLDVVNPLDSSKSGSRGVDIALTAWVWLDPKDQGDHMKTIFANRVAGCDVSVDRHGFALYVNTWQTRDRALKVDIGTGNAGCNSLATKAGVIPYGKWTHVAFLLEADKNDPDSTMIMLAVNGQVLASKNFRRGAERSHQNFRLGAHVDGQAPFVGNISELFIWDRAITDPNAGRQKLDSSFYDKMPPITGRETGLRAHFPLDWYGKQNKKELRIAEDIGPKQYKTKVILPRKRGARLANGGSSLGSNIDLSHLSSDIAADMNWGPDVLAAGTYPDRVSDELMAASDVLSKKRAEAVKNAMRHCWNGYKQHAWGYDELKPQSGRGQNNWGGMGVTLLDSLDTLWLMGMRDEFDEATEWIESHLNFNIGKTVSVFETTIRSLGGLLTAYDLSGKRIFLDKAVDLGRRLFRAFDSPSGIPVGQINLATGAGHNAAWTSSSSILAEIGTLQVEFRYLAEVSGNPEMFTKSTKVFKTVKDNNAMSDGLAPIYVSPQSGRFTTGRVTFGALGDSWYEYLLKCWIQGGKTEDWLREMYDNAMTGMAKKLLKRTSRSNLAYVSDWDGGRNVHKMDHLVCFLPGILALGAYTKPDSPNRDRDMMLAKSLMYTCYQMYKRTRTGIAPEYVEFPGGGDPVPASRAPFYILRPETAESLFVMHQVTGNPIYRDWSWDMFSAIEKYCKTQYGYGAWPDVRQTGRRPDDRMESFWLGETLKYFYLVQVPLEEHGIDLQKYVFNTEAHPTRTLPEVRAAIAAAKNGQ